MRVWPKKTGLMLGGVMRVVKELVCGIISLLPALLHFGWICTLLFLREWYFTLTRFPRLVMEADGISDMQTEVATRIVFSPWEQTDRHRPCIDCDIDTPD